MNGNNLPLELSGLTSWLMTFSLGRSLHAEGLTFDSPTLELFFGCRTRTPSDAMALIHSQTRQPGRLKPCSTGRAGKPELLKKGFINRL